MRRAYPPLFVTKLPSETDESALYQFFDAHIVVRAVFIVRDDFGGCRFAFVETTDEAKVELGLPLDGMEFDGQRLVVKRAHQR